MKKFFSLTLISLLSLSAFATDYAPMGDLPASPSQSSTVPLYTGSSTYTSIVQQLYYASELTAVGAEAGDITALKFYFGNKTTTVREVTRNLEIYIKLVPTSFTEFEVGFTNTDKYTYKFTDPGSSSNKVFDGNYTIPATVNNGDKIERTINTSRFYWDGTSNILVTVIDKTNKKFYILEGEDYSDSNLKSFGVAPAVTASRFVHMNWMVENSSEFTTYKNSLNGKFGVCSKGSTVESTERSAHSYVNYIKFTIESPLPVPTSPSASSITTSSAVLGWTAAAGADSYEVRYGTTSGSLGAATNVGNVTSYSLTGLTEETTYYYQIRTKIGTAYSAWTDEASFTTLAEVAHTHNDITFSKWSSTTAMPTSGNYYLDNDVTYDFYEGGYLDLAGDLNLCLNGHTINLGTKSINVTHTMTLFDHVGGGKITGFVAGDDGSLTFQGVISVESSGTLVLREGEVENTFPADDPEYKSIAIANGGTLIISGAPVISGNDMDIFLPPTIPSKVITIQSGKPLTNTTPYKVYKSDGVITSGWTYMSGADPADYFVSANPNKGIYYNGSEAELISILNLSDNADNSSEINTNNGQVMNVATNRSFTAGMYNTICMPFALSSAQIESVFGAGTDVQELSSSTYDGEYIDMYFSAVSAMAANTPYLINPANNVANAAFNGVTIVYSAASVVVNTSYVDLTGITSITALTASEDRYLLGANNKLGYLEANGDLKGMRAYFDTHNLGGGAAPAKRLRIAPDQSMPSALDEATTDKQVRKHMENGQLIIIRDGKRYNALGAEL